MRIFAKNGHTYVPHLCLKTYQVRSPQAARALSNFVEHHGPLFCHVRMPFLKHAVFFLKAEIRSGAYQ
jgi:hypothetical protein